MKRPPDVRAPRVVIVGGGFGGLYAALELRKTPARVTIVDRRNYHLFQPLLYQVATAALSPGDIAQPIRSVVRRQTNTEVILAEVVSIDVATRRLVLSDGTLPYDHLILAPGAGHSYFGHDDWADEAPTLKTLEDALEIRRRVLLAFEAAERAAVAVELGVASGSANTAGAKVPRAGERATSVVAPSAVAAPRSGGGVARAAELAGDWGAATSGATNPRALMTFVVVGGGPTGVELAGALAEIARHTLSGDFRAIDPSQARVLLVEAGPRILPSFPESLSGSAAAQLSRLGVEVKTSSKLEEIIPGRGVRLENGSGGQTSGHEWIDARNVLWAAGVEASPLARSLGVPLDRAGRVVVERDLTVPGHPEIQVIGDTASFVHQTGSPLPGVAPVAIQQGRHAARNVARALRGEPALPFHYRDKGNLATIGRSAAVADIAKLHLSGFVAWVAWAFVHIFFLIGFRNRFLVMFEWAWLYFTCQRGARLITGLPGGSRHLASDAPRAGEGATGTGDRARESAS